MSAAEPCELLPWDSEFFGVRIARVTAHPLGEPEIAALRRFAREQRVECLYYLADATDAPSHARAEAFGFRLMDVRLTLERSVGAETAGPVELPDAKLRTARAEDLPALRAIARVSHRDSRFYADPRFPDARCDALYERWIEKCLAQEQAPLFVAERGGEVAGYLGCGLAGGAAIELVAVAPDAQGARLGSLLVGGALAWFARRGEGRVRVVTQARNRAALRLYGALGFAAADAGLWFHHWRDAGAAR